MQLNLEFIPIKSYWDIEYEDWILLLHTTGVKGQRKRISVCYFCSEKGIFIAPGPFRKPDGTPYEIRVGKAIAWAKYPQGKDIK